MRRSRARAWPAAGARVVLGVLTCVGAVSTRTLLASASAARGGLGSPFPLEAVEIPDGSVPPVLAAPAGVELATSYVPLLPTARALAIRAWTAIGLTTVSAHAGVVSAGGSAETAVGVAASCPISGAVQAAVGAGLRALDGVSPGAIRADYALATISTSDRPRAATAWLRLAAYRASPWVAGGAGGAVGAALGERGRPVVACEISADAGATPVPSVLLSVPATERVALRAGASGSPLAIAWGVSARAGRLVFDVSRTGSSSLGAAIQARARWEHP